MGEFSFNQPGWFWLLLALPVIIGVLHRYARYAPAPNLADGIKGAETRLRHPHDSLLQQLASRSDRTDHLKLLVHVCVFVLLVTALAGPTRVGSRLPDPPRERDIVFIVDTSVSMILKDYLLDGQRVDRMRVIRSLLADFVTGLKGDRVSIIAFADTAHVLVPLTSDQALLHDMLPRLRTGIAGRSSAIGDALALAIKQARRQPARHQVLVLLTDAALPIGSLNPEQGAQLAAQAKLPLYTVAVGASSYAAAEERVTGLIYHPADIALLEKLASITGGKHYLAGDSDALQQAIADIGAQQANVQQLAPRYTRQPLYHWPLLAGLLLMSLLQLRGITPAGRRADA